MSVFFEPSYVLPASDEPLCNARIAHSGNWLSGGTATASTTDADFFEAGPLNSLTYEKWKPTGTFNRTWEYDHGLSAECDYCAIAAHDLASTSTTVRVQYFDGSVWVNLSGTETAPDDGPIFFIFEPTTAQRWRIVVDGGPPEIGIIRFGLALQMPQDIYAGHSPSGFSQQPILRTNLSEAGETLGSAVIRRSSVNNFSWDRLTHAWMTANWGALQRAVETGPLWVAWRPSGYQDVSFGMVEDVPIPEIVGLLDYMQVTLSVRSLGYD